jgi:glycosyltransferase involved in cell wall biosynthesis
MGLFMTPELSVVLPIHNQADHIARVLEQYKAEFQGRPWEIILVPNACKDDSLRICREIAEKSANIRVVENPAGGWGLSVRIGLQSAKGRFLCYSNSARTDPTTIRLLFDQFKNMPTAMVKISRFDRGDFLRSLGSMLYNFECGLLFHFHSPDVNGTPKIFASELLGRMKLTSDGDLLDAELLAWCHRLKVPILETPLGGWSRHGDNKSTTTFKSAAVMYLGAIRLWREMK